MIRSFSLELPIVVIGLGILMLINRTAVIPEAKPTSIAVSGENQVKN